MDGIKQKGQLSVASQTAGKDTMVKLWADTPTSEKVRKIQQQ